MKIYVLAYFDYEVNHYYFPTKKAALEFLAGEKKRFTAENAITDVEISELEFDRTKVGIADLLNIEVGTGF
mgnify:CR=1 FL=1